jgi:long-chain acyl-CoA synthetase
MVRPAGADKWYDDREALQAFAADLMISEMRRLRPTGVALPPLPWAADCTVDEQGLGLDSLERLTVASALGEALHLEDSGHDNALLKHRGFDEWIDILQAHLRRSDTRMTFRTSGSSGATKACQHQLPDLEQEIDYWTSRLAGTRRVISAVPRHHIYGFLFSVLLPARLGCEVLDVRLADVGSMVGGLLPGDLLISHPDHWAIIARHAGRLPADVVGVTSTAPCPDTLAQDLQACGLPRLLQIYGSSETAGIGSKEAPDTPYELMPYWSRDEVDAAVLLRRSPDGVQRPFPIQDQLLWHDHQRFTVLGRLDDAVQVGGVNVYPGRVRQALMEHVLVADASVRLMTPREGTRLKAFIVPAQGADAAAIPDALMAWSTGRLSTAERPKAYTVGDRLPRDERGKLTDWPIHGPLVE